MHISGIFQTLVFSTSSPHDYGLLVRYIDSTAFCKWTPELQPVASCSVLYSSMVLCLSLDSILRQ